MSDKAEACFYEAMRRIRGKTRPLVDSNPAQRDFRAVAHPLLMQARRGVFWGAFVFGLLKATPAMAQPNTSLSDLAFVVPLECPGVFSLKITGAASATVQIGGVTLPLVQKNANNWETTLALTDFAGEPEGISTVVVNAVDAAGATSTATTSRVLLVDDHLELLEQAVGATYLDIDATRILYSDSSGVHVKDRATGVSQTVGPGLGVGKPNVSPGYLADGGAIWNGGAWLGGNTLSGVGIGLGKVAGNWAYASVGGGPSRVSLISGAVEPFSLPCTPNGSASIDATGTIACSILNPALSWREVRLFPVGAAEINLGGDYWQPVVDGSRVLFQTNTIGYREALRMWTPAGVKELAGRLTGGVPIKPFIDYIANDGWAAFNGQFHSGGSVFLSIYTVSATGTIARATPFVSAPLSAPPRVYAVAPNGEVAYRWGSVHIGRADAGGPATPILVGGSSPTSTPLTMRYVAGDWFKLVDDKLYRVSRARLHPPGSTSGGIDGGADADATAGPDAAVANDAAADGDAADAGTDSTSESSPSSASSDSAGAPVSPSSSNDEPAAAGGASSCSVASRRGSVASAASMVLVAAAFALRLRRRMARRSR